jgi:hypothetical protein
MMRPFFTAKASALRIFLSIVSMLPLKNMVSAARFIPVEH